MERFSEDDRIQIDIPDKTVTSCTYCCPGKTFIIK
jgi:hypothetical protein